MQQFWQLTARVCGIVAVVGLQQGWVLPVAGAAAALHAGTSHRRTLQQQVENAPSESIVYVATAKELIQSIKSKARDIVIENHLDLTDEDLQNLSDFCEGTCQNPLGVVDARSIRGNCSAALTPPLEAGELAVPLRAGQCVLVADSDLFLVTAQEIWIDNLLLRLAWPNLALGDTTRKNQYATLIGLSKLAAPGEHYITRITFQGDGLGPGVGIWADSQGYVEDCTFVSLGGLGFSTCRDCTAALLSRARVTIAGCTFSDLYGGAKGTFVKAVAAAGVVIVNTTFAAAPQPVQAEFNALVFTDNVSLPLATPDGNNVAPQPLALAAAANTGADAGFLAADDAWFVSTQQEVVGEAVFGGWIGGGSSGGGSGGGLSTGLVAAIAALIAVVVVAAVAAWLFVRRRRRRRMAAQHDRGGAPSARSSGLLEPGLLVQLQQTGRNGSVLSKGSTSKALVSWQSASSFEQASPFRSMAAGPGTREPITLTEGTLLTASTAAPPTQAPSTTAPTAEKLDYLNAQLNTFTEQDVVLGRFKMLGEWERRQGGQGVVAFAVGASDRLGYAIKFFVAPSAFVAERQLYESRVLGALLPKIEDVYDPSDTPGRFVDRHGSPLPPCIVMERGESLNEWSRRAKPDVFQAVAVLAHVATRLRDMHQAGYVHRDIKPSNIMLLPRENRWTVIDFGSAAVMGRVATLSYTLLYAAPEVAGAVAAGARTTVVDPAMDAWALGVVAFELLTGQPTFDLLHDGKHSVMPQLRGEQELPWEGERLRSDGDMRKRLGVFKRPVLALLHRDPAQRASMHDFCTACHSLFSSPTTADSS